MRCVRATSLSYARDRVESNKEIKEIELRKYVWKLITKVSVDKCSSDDSVSSVCYEA